MKRENRKASIAAFHREQILKAAEGLFSEKGYAQTTVEDISKASGYSRRTVYSYYESKEDILRHTIEKGLLTLKDAIARATAPDIGFLVGCRTVCAAMIRYQKECSYSVACVNQARSASLAPESLSDTEKHILLLGTEINERLAALIERGKGEGLVHQEVVPALTVYVLWSSITALLTLADTKGRFISDCFSISENELLDYGFKQIFNSILTVRL